LIFEVAEVEGVVGVVEVVGGEGAGREDAAWCCERVGDRGDGCAGFKGGGGGEGDGGEEGREEGGGLHGDFIRIENVCWWIRCW
jgi:hypothetical protein